MQNCNSFNEIFFASPHEKSQDFLCVLNNPTFGERADDRRTNEKNIK